VEVKSVTLARGSDAYVPDAVSERSAAHVRELQRLAAAGHRSVLLFLVKRNDCCQVRLAEDIDPRYAEVLLKARGAVEVLAYRARVTSRSVSLELRLPFDP
jgi:sugar fermentation stimulation protein A